MNLRQKQSIATGLIACLVSFALAAWIGAASNERSLFEPSTPEISSNRLSPAAASIYERTEKIIRQDLPNPEQIERQEALVEAKKPEQ